MCKHFLPLLISCSEKRIKNVITLLPAVIFRWQLAHCTLRRQKDFIGFFHAVILSFLVIFMHITKACPSDNLPWQKSTFAIQRTQNVKIMHSRIFLCKNVSLFLCHLYFVLTDQGVEQNRKWFSVHDHEIFNLMCSTKLSRCMNLQKYVQ